MDASANTKSQLEMSRNYHDMGSVNKLREAAQSGDKGALEEAAKQFEAIFVQMMLKSMRKAQDALADKDSPFSSEQVKFYREMHDKQLATDLSANGSIGLADIIVQQMNPGDEMMPAGAVRSDGDLSVLNRHNVAAVQNAQDRVLGENNQNVAKDNVAAGAFKQSVFASPQEFVKALYPHAVEAAKALNISPKAMIAQAALETGWGKSIIHKGDGENSHNLFGIKADKRWEGEKAAVDTLEFVNNVAEKQQASFRSYGSFTDSLSDYVDFIKSNPRYEKATQKTESPQDYFEALQDAGYATDPKYAEKVMSVFNGSILGDLLP
ncbi:flagellar assembly peptidoglycan hydrolase FlgJ [Glaciecola sp. MH2013]|uniref:flagellar assembly peptidoglycan hydrolase FlgJ n=1 Tax=Glaciecola sp. MH2013 TaxID=2785524 RepID=UPI00189EAC58|nr:flagellar assembly peptidoglycan hydrolase FlgJ [Glaciecola sp. MH2013]MBF7072333.1 flagellar assembly peptidoglycan hydrolase FlgJ [Glaciecola sp. MH2013]